MATYSLLRSHRHNTKCLVLSLLIVLYSSISATSSTLKSVRSQVNRQQALLNDAPIYNIKRLLKDDGKMTRNPTDTPTRTPTISSRPSDTPTAGPTVSSQPSYIPSAGPSKTPSVTPSLSMEPSKEPSNEPSKSDAPSLSPSEDASVVSADTPVVTPATPVAPWLDRARDPATPRAPAYVSPTAPVYVTPTAPAPVYVAPVPVYVAPTPVYVAPTPVYVAPTPVYVAPVPVYVAPVPVYIAPSTSAPVYVVPAPVYYQPPPAYYIPAPVPTWNIPQPVPQPWYPPYVWQPPVPVQSYYPPWLLPAPTPLPPPVTSTPNAAPSQEPSSLPSNDFFPDPPAAPIPWWAPPPKPSPVSWQQLHPAAGVTASPSALYVETPSSWWLQPNLAVVAPILSPPQPVGPPSSTNAEDRNSRTNITSVLLTDFVLELKSPDGDVSIATLTELLEEYFYNEMFFTNLYEVILTVLDTKLEIANDGMISKVKFSGTATFEPSNGFTAVPSADVLRKEQGYVLMDFNDLQGYLDEYFLLPGDGESVISVVQVTIDGVDTRAGRPTEFTPEPKNALVDQPLKIAGIVAGVIFVLIIIASICCILRRRSRRSKAANNSCLDKPADMASASESGSSSQPSSSGSDCRSSTVSNDAKERKDRKGKKKNAATMYSTDEESFIKHEGGSNGSSGLSPKASSTSRRSGTNSTDNVQILATEYSTDEDIATQYEGSLSAFSRRVSNNNASRGRSSRRLSRSSRTSDASEGSGIPTKIRTSSETSLPDREIPEYDSNTNRVTKASIVMPCADDCSSSSSSAGFTDDQPSTDCDIQTLILRSDTDTYTLNTQQQDDESDFNQESRENVKTNQSNHDDSEIQPILKTWGEDTEDL
jgi:hypothetical protein